MPRTIDLSRAGISIQRGSPSGGSGSGHTHYGEVPAGAVNGVNVTFTLAQPPNPAAGLMLIQNGLVLKAGLDYTLASSTVTFGSAPISGDVLQAFYEA